MEAKKFSIKRHNVSPNYLEELREIFPKMEYKSPRNYTNNSRYSKLRLITDEVTGITHHESWTQRLIELSSDDEYYTVSLTDANRLDIISNYYYNTPRYWWVIALANYIIDPFDVPAGTYLRIPPLTSLYREGGVLRG